jgi:hypothetical protein
MCLVLLVLVPDIVGLSGKIVVVVVPAMVLLGRPRLRRAFSIVDFLTIVFGVFFVVFLEAVIFVARFGGLADLSGEGAFFGEAAFFGEGVLSISMPLDFLGDLGGMISWEKMLGFDW